MPSDTAIQPVAVLVWGILSADSALQGHAPGGIKDFVPTNRPFPFPTFVHLTFDEQPSNTFGRNGRSVAITANIWSQAEGWKDANAVLSDLIRLLDFAGANLAIPGWTTTGFMFYDGAVQYEDPDGLTRHLVVTFRALAEQ